MRCQTISDWFFEMSNWPCSELVWFSQQLRNAREISKCFGNLQTTNSWAVFRFCFVPTAPFLNIMTIRKSGPWAYLPRRSPRMNK